MKPVRIGCSGWNYAHWRESVYPKGVPVSRWLGYYATLFDTVEVNATFYRLPTAETVAGWAETVPEGFVFAIKASRYLTHIKRLRELESGIARFAERLEPLLATPKMGPVLWQLPETFHRDDERLATALDALPDWRHCIEFRHPSWFAADVIALLREHRVALVIGDHPERRFQSHELTTDWTYIRLHHGSRGRRGNYSTTELEAWKRRIASWRSRAEVFVYANNDWEAFAVRNATWLRERLS
ncbi:MAG TPA: DUF72 domain-containing protein [Solirubrobacterales bacterium]|nr:DUF72 domain-containing protein [Solirubrobacterales bacterium]